MMRELEKTEARHDGREAMGGTLPGQPPLRIWGGQGSGALCALCAEEIGPHQCEYEFEYASAGGRTTVHVHVQCYTAWELAHPTGRLAQAKT